MFTGRPREPPGERAAIAPLWFASCGNETAEPEKKQGRNSMQMRECGRLRPLGADGPLCCGVRELRPERIQQDSALLVMNQGEDS